MSKNQKYYWLKIKEDFFDDDTISYIEEQENGILYVNFYLKLCLKSLRSEGTLIRLVGEQYIPYDVKALAKLTNTPVDTVRVAMVLFAKIGLVKILETGEIYLTQIKEMTGSETDKAALMRRNRAKKKLSSEKKSCEQLMNTENQIFKEKISEKNIEEKSLESPSISQFEMGNNVTQKLPECYTEIRDKRLEIREEDIEEKSSSLPVNQIQSLYDKICISLDPAEKLDIDLLRATWDKYPDINIFKEIFLTVESTDYLNGKSNPNWKAHLNWIIKLNNFEKIKSGFYRKWNYHKSNRISDAPSYEYADIDAIANGEF